MEISNGTDAKPIWSLSYKRLFSVKSYYLHMTKRKNVIEKFPLKLGWKTKVTPTVAFVGREAV